MDTRLDMVRVPSDIRDKWMKMNPAKVGSLIEHNGRILRVDTFDVCPIATDVWSGVQMHVMGAYAVYLPEWVTAKELIELYESTKDHE